MPVTAGEEALVVHFSDTHVGRTLRGGGMVWQTTGHDVRVLEAFSNALGRVRLRRAKARMLVHSGDASATGDTAELDLYFTLRDRGAVVHGTSGVVRFPRFSAMFHQTLDIPGNHDFWNGHILNPILNHAVRTTYWPPTSWSIGLELGSYYVVFHGLCSTSGASKRQQFFAVGEFTGADLQEVTSRIERTAKHASVAGLHPVHVVVTHHSLSTGGRVAHGLSGPARAALEQLCTQWNVAAILSGHAHSYGVFHVNAFPPDVRASTVTQKNVWPQKQPHQFWVHRLRASGPTLTWEAVAWRYENRGFREIGPPRAVFSKTIGP